MARNSKDEEAACRGSNSEYEEDEDEALSLSDLPLNLVIEDESNQVSKEATEVKENEEEFNFDSWGGSLSTESEMCAADEVFFKGQILPLRLSVSSDSGLARFQLDSRNTNRCLSRSESMDHGSSTNMGGLTSINSSRSSSTRSHNSSNSSSSSSSCSITTITRNSKPRVRNQFHTFPSPKPQIRVSKTRLPSNSSSSRNQKSSTVWDFFRLGLVRAPEIELQDLKVRNNINTSAHRNSVSRNSSSGSSSANSSSSVKNYSNNIVAKNLQDLKLRKQQKKESFRGLFNGCKCSITAVEAVPLNNIVILKSSTSDGSSSNSNNKNNNNESSVAVDDMEKKMQESKIKKKMKEKQQGKQAMSRHRTFEWLKELSHASYADGLET
ncbi:Membrane-associated kinase regulator protein [Melia azedarach]|uniref:Membrane-associated kinase regulator protein n=1 Tax=Melia azedarach TaxID=155640 RepID=A0ACC1XUG5_MELAZ|nr:Membrane-associated kinase regulator protein [Melia azedarach]